MSLLFTLHKGSHFVGSFVGVRMVVRGGQTSPRAGWAAGGGSAGTDLPWRPPSADARRADKDAQAVAAQAAALRRVAGRRAARLPPPTPPPAAGRQPPCPGGERSQTKKSIGRQPLPAVAQPVRGRARAPASAAARRAPGPPDHRRQTPSRPEFAILKREQ